MWKGLVPFDFVKISSDGVKKKVQKKNKPQILL